MRLDHEGSMIGLQCQLMICRGHIRASKGTFQIFLWLMVLWQIDILVQFLGGLSLHLNHLIASRMANYDWPFGTLPFGLFGSNLDTRDLETYPRTYSGHF